MINVLKLNSISNKITEVFDDKYQLLTECTEPDAILVRSFQMANFPVSDNLLAVGRAGAGVNNIPFCDYAKQGIVVFNAPGANANAVKELVLSALLLSCRKIYEGITWAQNLKGNSTNVKTSVEKGKSQFVGGEILGKNLGIIGLGAIGHKVADSALALGMNVYGYDPYIKSDNFNKNIKLVTNIDEIYKNSDFITIHIPYLATTKGFINKESIEKMKDGVAIINCARGELVASQDIIDAVNDGKVFKYFTDFPTEEMLDINNIIPCPHLGASTYEAEDNCAVMVASQVKEYIESGNIKNSVNYPNISVERKTPYRYTILGANDNNLINKLNKMLKDNGIYVSAAKRDDVIYLIIDTKSELTNSFYNKLKSLDGVYRMRALQ